MAKCLIEPNGRKMIAYLSSDAIFLNVSGFFHGWQRETRVSVTRRNRRNDRSNCRLSGVAEAMEQQREVEGSDMSDTWSVDSFSLLFLSLSTYLHPSPSAYSFAECHYSHTIHPKYLRSKWFLWVPRKTLPAHVLR